MACEQLLLADLDDTLNQIGDAVLARPILIVVPSRSLRLHLLDRIVAHQGGASAGIHCLTLHALAVQITFQATRLKQPDADLLPILARRFAPLEPSLRRSLGHLHDGYAAVIGAVEDLLEAGFDPALEEALVETLEEEGPEKASYREVERARALVRIASRCLETLSQEGATRVSTLLQQATELTRLKVDELQAGTALIYGFADATGVATDLIQALLESKAGTLYLDQPPDPAWPDRADEGIAFGRRLAERLFLVTGPAETEPASHTQGSVQMFRALGGQAEIREVADRIRLLLDGGARPEGIGVVARQLEPYISPLRTHLWRLGVPFSGIGAVGPRTESGRQVRAVLDLLSQGRLTPVERWLDASLSSAEGSSFDLRLAFYGLGAGRLEEVAELELGRYSAEEDFPLPVRSGLAAEEIGDSQPGRRLEHRQIPVVSLVEARNRAVRLCQHLGSWQQVETLDRHLEELKAFLLDDLQWPADGELALVLMQAAHRLLEQTRAELPLTFDEMVRWLEETWSMIGRDALGGTGGGVQVLDVMEARGRTFEHLFVVGLNRGVFPRTVREDPLLPDSLRQVLSREGFGVLPDLPRKLAGFAEERFLFAQLLASSPSVTLSWQEVDDEGHQLSISPLVERMRWSDVAGHQEGWRQPLTVQPLFPLAKKEGVDIGSPPRLAYEHAVNAAMWGARNRLEAFLSAAFDESCTTPPYWKSTGTSGQAPLISTPEEVARARIRILGEVDPIRGDREGELTFAGLGPFFGFVGPVTNSQDLRFEKRLYVTALESLAGCPWQTFLSRILRLEALPDPLEILPGISPVLIGDLVHQCLERLVSSQLTRTARNLETAHELAPQIVSWPADRELDRLLDRQAELVARRHGIGMRGFSAMLARVARPYLDRARQLEWASGDGLPVVAVEVEGCLTLPLDDGEDQELYFKADRLDVDDDGERLVDYKTGKNDISSAAGTEARHKNLIKRIRTGKSLQAVTYAQAARSESSNGAYLFLKPDLEGPESARIIGIAKGDKDGQLAFRSATSTLVAAWKQGSFFPRLVEADRDKAPRRCDSCQVAEACLRYDSGSRGRLRTWMAAHLEAYIDGPDRTVDAENASLGVWILDSKRLLELDENEQPAGGGS